MFSGGFISDIFGFISDKDGQLTPLYDGSIYYVMTESGATFERIDNHKNCPPSR